MSANTHMAQSTSESVRSELVEALQLDLVGPTNEHPFAQELLPELPTRWYLTGFLAPSNAPLDQRTDETSSEEIDSASEAGGLDENTLREVLALTGFTRFEAAGPDIEGELSMAVERASLSLNVSWLPAVENRGEGIFLLLKQDTINAWMQKPAVLSRAQKLVDGFNLWKTEHPNSTREFPKIPYYLVHSLAHLLITAISLECGYPISSLRERIYAFDNRYGLLIYTGSSDAEGTLGGLIVAGWNIKRHMHNALEMGMLCSNDPVCAYHLPTEHDQQQLQGSACHGCLLVSETSCEQRNDFLDRSLVVQTVEALGAELFEDFA